MIYTVLLRSFEFLILITLIDIGPWTTPDLGDITHKNSQKEAKTPQMTSNGQNDFRNGFSIPKNIYLHVSHDHVVEISENWKFSGFVK